MDFFPPGLAARIVNALGWIAAVLILIHLVKPHRGGFAADYLLQWTAAHAREHAPFINLYDTGEGQRITNAYREWANGLRPDFAAGVRQIGYETYVASPLLYAVTKASSQGDLIKDSERWRDASVLLFAVGLVLFAAVVGVPGPAAAVLLAAFTCWSPGFWFGVALANATVIVSGALLILLAGLRVRHDAATFVVGAALGFVTAMKATVLPVPALLGVLFLVQRRWRTAICFCAGGALAVAGGVVWSRAVLGPGYSWVAWYRCIPDRLLTHFWLGGSFLGKLVGPPPRWVYPVWTAFLLASASVWIYAVARTPGLTRSRAFAQEAAVAALGAALALVSDPVVHSFYFMQAAPAAIVAVGAARPPWRRLVVGAALAAAALFLFNNNTLFTEWDLTHHMRHSLMTYAGVWILIGASAWRLRVVQGPVS